VLVSPSQHLVFLTPSSPLDRVFFPCKLPSRTGFFSDVVIATVCSPIFSTPTVLVPRFYLLLPPPKSLSCLSTPVFKNPPGSDPYFSSHNHVTSRCFPLTQFPVPSGLTYYLSLGRFSRSSKRVEQEFRVKCPAFGCWLDFFGVWKPPADSLCTPNPHLPCP